MPKRIGTIWFGQKEDGDGGFTARPRNKDEAQKFTNQEIVKVIYWPLNGEPYVCRASTWDGESYGSSTASWSTKLCSGQCAKELGLAAAEHGMTSKKYAAKMKDNP